MIKPDFIIKDAIALVDSGADMNCIQEGIVPTRYFEKTTQSLTSASGNSLQIRYKVPEAYICNQDLCLPTSFVLVRNLATNIILGTPFLCLLMPIQKIDSTGIYSQLQGKTIIFEFITQPYTKELDQIRDLISVKQNQINLIQKEVSFLTTEQRLNQSVTKGALNTGVLTEKSQRFECNLYQSYMDILIIFQKGNKIINMD